jgi:hypothetical protein
MAAAYFMSLARVPLRILLTLVTASLAGAADQALSQGRRPAGGDESKHYTTAWGDIEVALTSDPSEAMIGEPVYLSFTVRNLSTNNLQTIQGGDYQNGLGRPESYAVTVVSRNGEALPVLDAGPSFGGLIGPEKIPAKGTWVRRLFLPHWVALAGAGDYTVTAKTVLKLSQPTPGGWEANEKTTDIQVEVATPLKVVPTDPKRMGDLIETLGKRMLNPKAGASDEASRSLAWIQDERVIPFFNQAVATDDYNLKFTALEALAKFKSDEALRGIKAGLATQASDLRAHATTDALAGQLADNIRHSAAVALSRSPNPEAAKLLLTLWQDPYYAVRLDVLHALGKMDSADSLELLRKMTSDNNAIVRNEALRYLKRGTEKPPEAEGGK